MIDTHFESLADARCSIEKIMMLHPDLTYEGFCASASHLGTHIDQNAEVCRNKLLADDACRQFNVASAWLERCLRTEDINRLQSSYGLKERVERWAHAYVSNGAFIAAAIHLGYRTIRAGDNPNVYLNISEKGRP